jgi:allantoicase
MTNNTKLQQLKSSLIKIEKELSTCRTSVLQDGWQTQRHAKKARKWDILAQRKMEIIQQIDDIENEKNN